jgi:hypothetical protein
VSSVSKGNNACILRVKQSKKRLGLLGVEADGAMILRNVGNYLPSGSITSLKTGPLS